MLHNGNFSAWLFSQMNNIMRKKELVCAKGIAALDKNSVVLRAGTQVLCGQETQVICGQEISVSCGQGILVICGQETQVLCGQEISVLCGKYVAVQRESFAGRKLRACPARNMIQLATV